MTIKVILAGPRGRMGLEALQMIQNEREFELVACIDRKNDGKKLSEVEGLPSMDVFIYEDAEKCLKDVKADVLVDLTIPDVGFNHTKLAILNGVRPVVGTSGFSSNQIDELTELCKQKEVGGIIAPNFAIGAVLMMKFSQLAAKHLPHVEIIEKHHDKKLDAPSGTAVKTAEIIAESRNEAVSGNENEFEVIRGARGANKEEVHIHSVRLPGLVAHQEVIFGGPGQTLSIKHDSFNRDSFMDGINFSIKEVMSLNELIYGLENIIE